MKGQVIGSTRLTLLVSVLHSQIVWGKTHIVELLSSRKVDTQLFRKYLLRFKVIDPEFWIGDGNFEISDVNE